MNTTSVIIKSTTLLKHQKSDHRNRMLNILFPTIFQNTLYAIFTDQSDRNSKFIVPVKQFSGIIHFLYNLLLNSI